MTSWILKMTHESMTEKVKEQLATMFEIHIDNTFELFQEKQFREPIA